MHKFLKYSSTWYFPSEGEEKMSKYHKAEGTANARIKKKNPNPRCHSLLQKSTDVSKGLTLHVC